jgi:predicted TIM-barrel fold metal-dependent hydrolase
LKFAVDSHAHVFLQSLPLAASIRYAPQYDATLADYLAQLDRQGLSHGVLVQPSFLGTDNQFLVQALKEAKGRLRGVAVVNSGIALNGLHELEELAQAGVVGLRLNLIGTSIPDVDAMEWQTLWQFVAAQQWHVEVHAPASDLPSVIGPLLAQGLRVVVDHFGRPDSQLGTHDPGFAYLLEQAKHRQIWVKLSGAYRIDEVDKALPKKAAIALLEHFGPERLVWGSDWPHTLFESKTSYAQNRAALDDWVPDARARETILGESAAALFNIESG